MTAAALVTDTHPLIWYVSNQPQKLSQKVLRAFDQAVAGETAIWVPAAVLWELSILLKVGKIRLACTLEELVENRFYAQAIHLTEMNAEDVLRSHDLSFTSDPWDTMIVAAALRLDCALITRDQVIHRIRPCAVYWD